MPIYHLNAGVVKRSEGHSAVAAAAYRAGEKLADERTGEVHDYTRRGGVNASEILAPAGAPAWALSRETLWNRVESAERRKDAQVAREVRVAIPSELSRDAGRDLVRDYVRREFVDSGMVADVAWHDEGGNNPHAHILLTMRQIDRDDFGKKVRTWNDKETLVGWREAWAEIANHALEVHGNPERIDHRTLAAQRVDAEARGDHEAALRLDRPPTMHRGKVLTHRPAEAAPDRHLQFADAEAERRVAIALAEDIIELEARVAAGAAEHTRLAAELEEAIAEVLDAIPQATRAERLAHARQPPQPAPLPTPPEIERDVLIAELADRENNRLIDAIPEETRAERLANARGPAQPRPLPAPPVIEHDVLMAEAADREDNRRLIDAIPEATRAERLAHARQPPQPAPLPTPPEIEREVLVAERTRREAELIAAVEAAEQKKDQDAAERETKRIEAAELKKKRADAADAAAAAKAAANEKEWAFDEAVRDARGYEVPRAAAELLARQPAVPLDPVDAELVRRHATDDRYNEKREIDGATVRVGAVRMDLEGAIIDHATSHHGRGASRVPPARSGTLGVTAAVEAIQKAVDRLLTRILDRVFGRDREPAPAAATLTAAAPPIEQRNAQGGGEARDGAKTDRPSRETTREDSDDASAPALQAPGVGIDDQADEGRAVRARDEPNPGGAEGDPRAPASTPKQDLKPD